MDSSDKRFAVLIDADNVSDKYIKIILDELADEGQVTYKRIYGDWTKTTLGPWKKVLLEYSLTPIQQYSYTSGKNATDSAMIIDAMDILYTGNVDGFCLVTSDSDFTRLASRLRESGMLVVGMGEQKTPRAFTSACNKFKYLDILAKNEESSKDEARKPAARSARSARSTRTSRPAVEKPKPDPKEEIAEEEETITPLKAITQTLINILREDSDEDGWVSTSDLGNKLLKRYSDFDVRNYGFSKLTPFLKSLKGFEMKSVRTANSQVKQVYLREEQQNKD